MSSVVFSQKNVASFLEISHKVSSPRTAELVLPALNVRKLDMATTTVPPISVALPEISLGIDQPGKAASNARNLKLGMPSTPRLPPVLAEISFGTGHILTKEFARIIRREVQTIRKMFSQKGEVYGVVPQKFGNRLLWPVQEVAALLQGAKG